MTTATSELYAALQSVGITNWPDRWAEKWIGKGATEADIEHLIGKVRERMVENPIRGPLAWIDAALRGFARTRDAGGAPGYELEGRDATTARPTPLGDAEYEGTVAEWFDALKAEIAGGLRLTALNRTLLDEATLTIEGTKGVIEGVPSFPLRHIISVTASRTPHPAIVSVEFPDATYRGEERMRR